MRSGLNFFQLAAKWSFSPILLRLFASLESSIFLLRSSAMQCKKAKIWKKKSLFLVSLSSANASSHFNQKNLNHFWKREEGFSLIFLVF